MFKDIPLVDNMLASCVAFPRGLAVSSLNVICRAERQSVCLGGNRAGCLDLRPSEHT